MTYFLLATDSVHTTAAACDYLVERLSEGDVVTVLTVDERGADPRDGGDAQNVAMARLAGLATVEQVTREGEPAAAILDLLANETIDEVVMGAHRGGPVGTSGVGGTLREVIFDADVPVVVVPQERLE